MKTQKGITLIALVITIIVMMILVAVSVTVALNGGLFTTAKNAAEGTQREVKAEQKLADGKIKIGDNWYASYQDYKDGKILEPGIILEESLKIEIPEEYDVETAPVTKELTATLNEIEGNVIWEVDNEEIATIVGEGTKVTVTAVAAGTAKITATCEYEGETYTAECEITVKVPVPLARGSFVQYDVEYTDAYEGYEYTKNNGWRLLDYTENEDGTYSNVKLISTGIPAKLYYSTTTTNNDWWVEEETMQDPNAPSLSKFREILGGEEYYTFYTGTNTYSALQAAAGMYYNFGKIEFAYAADSRGDNLGYFESISVYEEAEDEPTTYDKDTNNTAIKSGDQLFKVREDASVRILTLAELNTLLGRSNGADDSVDSTTTISATEDPIGLYRLNQLDEIEGMEDYIYRNGYYWLASPNNQTYSNRDVLALFYSGAFRNSYDLAYGVRPVICLSSNIRFIDSNDDGALEIIVVQ